MPKPVGPIPPRNRPTRGSGAALAGALRRARCRNRCRSGAQCPPPRRGHVDPRSCVTQLGSAETLTGSLGCKLAPPFCQGLSGWEGMRSNM